MAKLSLLDQSLGTIDSETQVASTSGTTTHDVRFPRNTRAGDLILFVGTIDGNPTITPPSGFTQRYLNSQSAVNGGAWSAVASGTEGGEVRTFTTDATERAAFVVYRLDGVNQTFSIESATATSTTGSTGQPPQLQPTWGNLEAWFIATLHASTGQTLDSGPTDYLRLESVSTGATTADAQVYSARRLLTTDDETPGAFTMSGTGATKIMGTLGVRWDQEATLLSGSASLAGTLTASGAIDFPLELAGSGVLVGGLTGSGILSAGVAVELSGAAALGGTMLGAGSLLGALRWDGQGRKWDEVGAQWDGGEQAELPLFVGSNRVTSVYWGGRTLAAIWYQGQQVWP